MRVYMIASSVLVNVKQTAERQPQPRTLASVVASVKHHFTDATWKQGDAARGKDGDV